VFAPARCWACYGATWTLERGLIYIRRIQAKRSGDLIEATKTAAGTRSVPLTPVLRDMLLSWRVRCPLLCGAPHRVFPAPEGGPLFYNNFRTRYWLPTLARLGLPAVSPHSARHSFISTLQAQGVDVATVAKLAGHRSASVTLGFYMHSVGGADAAVAVLDRAFGTDHVTGNSVSATSGGIEIADQR
jgi:integrase